MRASLQGASEERVAGARQATVRAPPDVLEGHGDSGYLTVSRAKLGTKETSIYRASTNRS